MKKWYEQWWGVIKDAFGIKYSLVIFIILCVLTISAPVYNSFTSKTIEEILGISPVYWAVITLLEFIVVIFAHALKLNNQINDGRVQLSILRQRGVEIRNELRKEEFWGNGYFDRLEDWKIRASSWDKDTYEAIKTISVADAEWYRTLDVVPPPRLPHAVDKDIYEYNYHDFRLKRLGDMIRDLWGRQ